MAKHHFIPQFYLRNWALNNDGRVVAFKRVNSDIVSNLYKPEYTGYENNLYKHMEIRFFSQLDNDANNIVNKFGEPQALNPILQDLGEKDHRRWAQFILGLIFRMPDKIEVIKKSYGLKNVPEKVALDQISHMLEWEQPIKDLRNLKWVFARIDGTRKLLTCDRPLIFKPSNLADPDCIIILPMGPRHFFLATGVKNLKRLEQNPYKMVRYINKEIVMQAEQRVYATAVTDVENIFLDRNMRNT